MRQTGAVSMQMMKDEAHGSRTTTDDMVSASASAERLRPSEVKTDVFGKASENMIIHFR